MARSTNYRGLTNEALEFLKKHAEFQTTEKENAWGGKTTEEKPIMEKIGECGMFEEIDLVRYKLKDGTYVEEFVQGQPWASGPHIFVALRKENGEEIGLWSEKEFDDV